MSDDGHAANNLRDESVFLEVGGGDIFKQVALVEHLFAIGAITDDVGAFACGDDAFNAVESASCDEEDVFGVDGDHLLLGMLASSLGWHVGDGAFEKFQEGLLNAFARHVAGDAGVVALAGDLVDFVDEHDAVFRGGDVVVGGLQQSHEDVLHVLAHVASLGEDGGIGDGEGNVEHPGDGACQQGLARAGLADEDHVRFLDFHLVGKHLLANAFVMVVDGHGQSALGFILADDVLIKEILDLLGLLQLKDRSVAFLGKFLSRLMQTELFLDDKVSLLGTMLADLGFQTLKQHDGVTRRSSAERAMLPLFLVGHLTCF